MTSTIPQPPTEREVSSARRDAMHDQLRRRIAAERYRQARGPRAAGPRRHLLPLVAAAAVLVVLGATVTVLTLIRNEKPAPPAQRPTPIVSATPSRQVTPQDQNFTAQAGVLRDACATALRDEEPGATSNQTPPAREFVDLDALRFLGAATDNEQFAAAFTDDETMVFCVWSGPGGSSPMPPSGQVRLLGYRKHVQWMPGPVTVELSTGAGGEPWSALLVGRAVATAKTVEVVNGDMVTVVPVRNGTFVAAAETRPGTSRGPITVRALAADGSLLGEWRQGQRVCAVDPNGAVVFGVTDDPGICVRAVPWR
ncbi:hypothetical protein [Cryptosporangium japonicum]|uniref:Uncharacterized protein n=1 Tax=Cryptosporangium japonicum TaxID=80872 RepID=A0ABN0UEZ3_9ACTN